VNIVYKAHPYYPNLDSFDPRWSFSQEDVDLLADLGMNAIRLDVSWAGAEPEQGVYNQTYFDVVHKIIKMCDKRGIYVLLEWHQDLFSERYCGNGAPLWASRPLNPHSKFGYPFPAWKPFGIVGESRIANHSDCQSFSNFAFGYFSWQLSQAFQDLYNNFNGVRDSLYVLYCYLKMHISYITRQ
jgi:endoglycosylceramidase